MIMINWSERFATLVVAARVKMVAVVARVAMTAAMVLFMLAAAGVRADTTVAASTPGAIDQGAIEHVASDHGDSYHRALDHSVWNDLLQQHITVLQEGQATQVDYAGMATDRVALKSYLQALEAVKRADFDAWPPAQQLAFLINAYNAWTVELILTAYPDLESIKDLGSLFSSPWKKAFIPLLGETRSLDDIEHALIRGSGRYNDPRIHFAVNCASVGCPALRAEAFIAERLDGQLAEQTRLFLADRSRNRLQGDTLEVSSIFKWYREDFEKGWLGYQSLEVFFAAQSEPLGLSESDVQRLQAGKLDIDFLDYDWDLNGKK
jgi:hypothetical protein